MKTDTLKIFIASSAELEQDRKAFRELLSVENDRLHYKGVYLELVQWEYFFNAISQNSKQDDYNEKLKECDIVICLFYTKAGKYTQLEFDTALKQFNDTGAPLIYTYFKEPESTNTAQPVINNVPETDPVAEQCRQDLISFKKRLGDIGHFYTRYINIDSLKLQFLQQLDILQDKGFPKLQEEVRNETKEAVTNYINNINTANVLGNNNIVIQGVTDSVITVNVNGKTEEIMNELGAMRAVLEKLSMKSFQADGKEYDMNGIDKSNFAFVMGRAGQNKNLPDELKDNLLSEDSKWFLSLQLELKKKKVTYGETPNTIFPHFGWLIEAYLQKFVTLTYLGPTIRRLSFLAEAYQSSLRFLCFVQLSQVLQLEKKPQHAAINQFIKLEKAELALFDYSNLLLVTTDLLQGTEPFMPEIKEFVEELSDTHSDLYSINLFLENNRNKVVNKMIDEDDQLPTLINEYLTALVSWLKKLTFISQYKMVSIRDIKLEYRMGSVVQFEHVYGELNGVYKEGVSVDEDASKETSISIEGVYTFNQSILLMKGKNVEMSMENIRERDSYISLSPLIIDLSVYSEIPKQTPEIFFYTGQDASKKQYNYANYRNELLPINDNGRDVNKELNVRSSNINQPSLDTLHTDLDDLLKPFKSKDK